MILVKNNKGKCFNFYVKKNIKLSYINKIIKLAFNILIINS